MMAEMENLTKRLEKKAEVTSQDVTPTRQRDAEADKQRDLQGSVKRTPS